MFILHLHRESDNDIHFFFFLISLVLFNVFATFHRVLVWQFSIKSLINAPGFQISSVKSKFSF